ncbi:MAG: hypothetical protein PHN19_04910 [Patescibacteria group bacterium]|nr:hypothetical protein [Patescibacteria group bacterium]
MLSFKVHEYSREQKSVGSYFIRNNQKGFGGVLLLNHLGLLLRPALFSVKYAFT